MWLWSLLNGYGAGFHNDDPSMVMEGLPIDRDNPVGVYGGDPLCYINDEVLLPQDCSSQATAENWLFLTKIGFRSSQKKFSISRRRLQSGFIFGLFPVEWLLSETYTFALLPLFAAPLPRYFTS